jgi:glycosyltransferase involved in cell wall biosynthesis
MNLLHVTPYFAPAWAYGGVPRAVTGLARAQAAAGHLVRVITTDALAPSSRLPAGEFVIDGVRVTRVPNLSNALRARFNLSTPRGFRVAVRRLLAADAVDIVHAHELRTVENQLVVRLVGGAGLPFVVSPHGTLPYETGRGAVKRVWDRLLGRRVLRTIDCVVALTAVEARAARALWARAGVPLADAQVSVVPNGVDVDAFGDPVEGGRFRERWRLGRGPVVLFLGRLAERKGLPLLVEAFAAAAQELPAARLVVAGPDGGMRAALERQAAGPPLDAQVVFTGFLDGADVRAALAAADLFALPATGEGFSMAALEAMASGRPPVLSPDCHFSEVADEGCGLVVPLHPDAWRDALVTLLTDPDRRASMGRRARELVRERYSWVRISAQLERVYHAVLRDTRSG